MWVGRQVLLALCRESFRGVGERRDTTAVVGFCFFDFLRFIHLKSGVRSSSTKLHQLGLEQAEVWNSVRVSFLGGRSPRIWAFFCCLPGA